MKYLNRLARAAGLKKLLSMLFKAKDMSRSIRDISEQLQSLHSRIEILQRSVEANLVPTIEINKPVRVVFLAHHPTSWSASRPVVEEMLRDGRFEVTVISLPHFYLMCNRKILDGEGIMHDNLTGQQIPHTRISADSIEECSSLLRAIKPHVIFRQTPWDHDLPPSLSGRNLSFSRLCYIPYGYMTAAIQDKQFNQEFHWFCYQICWPDSVHQEMSEKYSAIGARNCTVTGYPKFDDLLMGACNSSSNSKESFHLIWAPHYSYQDNWLRFGALWELADYLFALASENSRIKITLRPHPALQEKIRSEPDPRLSSFMQNWQMLPNTALSEEADYSQLFGNSDAMLTDGLSFISEYQLFDKPLLFYTRSDSIGFNEAGHKLLDGTHKVHTQDELHKTLSQIMNDNENPEVIKARREIASAIRPYPRCAAKNIVDSLYSKLISEELS